MASQPPASRVPMRAHGTLVAAEGAVRTDDPRPALQGHPYAGRLLRPERAAAEGDRPLSRVRAEGGRRRHGDLRHPPARRSPCRARPTPAWNPRAQGFGADRAVSVAGRRGAVCADRSGTEGSRTTRGRRSRSVTRTTTPMSPRCVARRRGKWPSGCCCPRTRSVRSRPRSKASSRSSGSDRRMGRAQRYPSSSLAVIATMGFAVQGRRRRLYPSYAWSQPQGACPEVDPPAPSVGL